MSSPPVRPTVLAEPSTPSSAPAVAPTVPATVSDPSAGPPGGVLPTSARGSQRLALWAGLITVFVWGVNFAAQKALFEVLPPGAFLFARYVLMPLCAVALVLWTFQGRWPRLPRSDVLQLAGLGVLGHLMHVGLVTYGIHWSTAFSSALILACGPVFTLLILHVLRIERLRRTQVLGVSLALAGVLLFLSDKLLGRQWAATGGDLVLLFAASLFSLYTVLSKPLIQRHGPVTVMGYATVVGALPVLLVSAWPALYAPWGAMNLGHWGLLLWSALISAFAGWLVWGWVNERRGVARTAPLMYLMPLVAGVVAWLFTGERFSGVKLVGALVTLGGVAWAQLVSGPARDNPAQVD